MPELPEVETVRRGLVPVLEGAVIDRVELRRADLRFPFPHGFAERCAGRRVLRLGRRAKYLLAGLDDETTILMHLGMSGSFRVEGGAAACPVANGEAGRARSAAHDHAILHLRGGIRIVYNDPRRFGFMLLLPPGGAEFHPLLAALGPEPLGDALSAAALAPRLAGRAAPIKTALCDQRLIAGLGNIYASEALWRAGISPRRATGTLVRRDGQPTARLARLVQAIRGVVAEAAEAGGSSLRDHVRTDGSLGRFQHAFAVYDRAGETCRRPGCGGTIHRLIQAGRSTFHCPECQR